MNDLAQILKSKRMNDNRGIQKALREIDTHILALCTINIEKETLKPIFRNMSKRAVAVLEKEIEIINDKNNIILKNIDEMTIKNAQKVLYDLLLNWTGEVEKPYSYPEAPELKLSNFSELIDTLTAISTHAKKYGLMSLDSIEKQPNESFLNIACDLLLEGYEPMLFEEIIENYLNKNIAEYKIKLTMIKEGFKSIQMGDNPLVTKEKLKSISIGS